MPTQNSYKQTEYFRLLLAFVPPPSLSVSISLLCIPVHSNLFSLSFCDVVVFYRSVDCIIMFYADLVYAICVMASFHGSENGKL